MSPGSGTKGNYGRRMVCTQNYAACPYDDALTPAADSALEMICIALSEPLCVPELEVFVDVEDVESDDEEPE